MAPIVDEAKNKYEGKVVITQLDIDKEENKAKVDEHGIRAVPTFVFINAQGDVAKKVEGAISKKQLEAQIESLLGQSLKDQSSEDRGFQELLT